MQPVTDEKEVAVCKSMSDGKELYQNQKEQYDALSRVIADVENDGSMNPVEKRMCLKYFGDGRARCANNMAFYDGVEFVHVSRSAYEDVIWEMDAKVVSRKDDVLSLSPVDVTVNEDFFNGHLGISIADVPVPGACVFSGKHHGLAAGVVEPVMDSDGIARCKSYDTEEHLSENRKQVRDMFVRYDRLLDEKHEAGEYASGLFGDRELAGAHEAVAAYLERVDAAESVSVSDLPRRQADSAAVQNREAGVQSHIEHVQENDGPDIG